MQNKGSGRGVLVALIAAIVVTGFIPLGEAIPSHDAAGPSTVQDVGDRSFPAYLAPLEAAGAMVDELEAADPGAVRYDPMLDAWAGHTDGFAQEVSSLVAGTNPLLPKAMDAAQAPQTGCVPHPPIEITEEEGTEGFILGHDPVTGEPIYRPGSGVVDGSGAEDDPYVIEGWCIENVGNPQGMPACIATPPDFETECGTFPQHWVGFPQAAITITGTDAHVVVQGNVLVGNSVDTQLPYTHGVLLDEAHNVHVHENVGFFLNSGVVVHNANDVSVAGNTFAGLLFTGVASTGSQASIVENTVLFAFNGITVSDAQTVSVEVANNHVSEIAWTGIRIGSTESVHILGNTVEKLSNDQAISLRYSYDALLNGNEIEDGGIRLDGDDLSHFLHDIDETNLVNGEPVRYVRQAADETVQEPAGQVILVDAENIRVEEVTIKNTAYGIHVLHSENVTISNASIEDTRHGIQLYETHNSIVIDSFVEGAFPDPGIFVHRSNGALIETTTVRESGVDLGGLVSGGMVVANAHGTTLKANTLEDNEAIGLGIWGGSTETRAIDNEASGNGLDGIYAASTTDTEITGSLLEHNDRWGLFVHNTDHARIAWTTANAHPDGGIAVHESHDVTVQRNEARSNGVSVSPINGIGVLVEASTEVNVNDNNLVDNNRAGFYAYANPDPLDATSNWWGCPGGPDDDACDTIETHDSHVIYDPWRMQPVHDAGAGG